MRIDPDTSLSLEAVILRKWETAWDAELKADLLHLAERLGSNWWDAA